VATSAADPERKVSIFMETVLSRRSVMPKRLGEPGPSHKEIQDMVDAALTAPDHNQLTPWRLVLVPEEKRDHLARAFIQGKVRRRGDVSEEEMAIEFDKAHSVPVMIALITALKLDEPEVPVEEQYVAIGAALQNMLLCAHASGYGAVMLSGNRVRDAEVRTFLDVPQDQHLLGFVCMGSIKSRPRDVTRRRHTDVLRIA